MNNSFCAINSLCSPLVVSNIQPRQTFKITTYICTASDSWLSDSFLWNWLIPPWMPNWCTFLKAALSVLVFPPAWSAGQQWPPLTDADPKLNCLDLSKASRKCSWVERRKTEIQFSSFKVYGEITERKYVHIECAHVTEHSGAYAVNKGRL